MVLILRMELWSMESMKIPETNGDKHPRDDLVFF